MKIFDTKVKESGLSPAEVAIRWIAHHSVLTDEDGIIVGASKTSQISETVAFIQKGPLPVDLLTLAEELWGAVQETRGEIV